MALSSMAWACSSVTPARIATNSDSTFCFAPNGPRTVTTRLHELELPAASIAVESTVVVPIPNRLPGGGTEVIVTPEHVSAAEILNKTGAPASFPNSVVMFEGHVIVGGVASITVIVAEHMDDAPWLS